MTPPLVKGTDHRFTLYANDPKKDWPVPGTAECLLISRELQLGLGSLLLEFLQLHGESHVALHLWLWGFTGALLGLLGFTGALLGL